LKPKKQDEAKVGEVKKEDTKSKESHKHKKKK
jgi:hypothetical protein